MQSLIHMAGGIALLLWGAYMVKTGMLRTFGVALKDFLSVRLKNRAIAMASGTTLASLLQSSTAATLIVASIQAEGFLTTNMAFATILGADFGSALMTRVLTFDLSFLSPLLIFIGTCLFFMRKADTRQGQFGRILIGLGSSCLRSASSWPPRCRCARARSSRLSSSRSLIRRSSPYCSACASASVASRALPP